LIVASAKVRPDPEPAPKAVGEDALSLRKQIAQGAAQQPCDPPSVMEQNGTAGKGSEVSKAVVCRVVVEVSRRPTVDQLNGRRPTDCNSEVLRTPAFRAYNLCAKVNAYTCARGRECNHRNAPSDLLPYLAYRPEALRNKQQGLYRDPILPTEMAVRNKGGQRATYGAAALGHAVPMLHVHPNNIAPIVRQLWEAPCVYNELSAMMPNVDQVSR